MKLITLFVLLFSLQAYACDGGMAFNKRRLSIPVNSILANDMTEQEFKKLLKDFESFFLPTIDRDYNSELIVIGSWASNAVNAFADQGPKKMMITIYGGLARHAQITQDGVTGALCHELGHHLGGYPKKTGNKWSSAEGQADYFATMKCLRRIWEKADNRAAVANLMIPSALRAECAKTYSTASSQALCQRMGMAALSVSLMLQDLDHDSITPKFETPDPLIVRNINYMHPFSQCRLDTFFQGAICPVSESIDFDNDDEVKGACHAKLGDQRGLRPRCWFVPRN